MNKEVQNYQSILSSEVPKFLNKYLKTNELQRLKKIGFFCGVDYTDLIDVKTWYSRYDHSLSVALITWNFTHNEEETIVALLHDIGTPAFSHIIDFMDNDYIVQNSSELNIIDVINSSPKLKKLLEKDKINIKRIADFSNYPILESDAPKLCADRLDATLIGIYALAQKASLKDIKRIYASIIVLTNEDNKKELGFNSKESAEFFFEKQYHYSLEVIRNENKFTLQYISDILKTLINKGIISRNDLYVFSEKKIITLIKKNFDSWIVFEKSKKVTKSKGVPLNNYFVSIDVKRKYTNPLYNDILPKRVIDNSERASIIFKKYSEFKDSKYTYIKELRNL